MKSVHRFALAALALALAGCSSGNAASTTVAASVAPPTPPPTTMIAPTTTTAPSPTTTEASTTAPPTTAAQTPEQAIAERHLAFAHAVDECFMDPEVCDPAAAFVEYADPDSEPYKFYSDARDKLAEKGQRVTQPERIKREIVLVEVLPDRTSAHTVNCIANAAVYVKPNNETFPPSVAYGREDYFWTFIDGKWIVTNGILDGISDEGDGECTF